MRRTKRSGGALGDTSGAGNDGRPVVCEKRGSTDAFKWLGRGRLFSYRLGLAESSVPEMAFSQKRREAS